MTASSAALQDLLCAALRDAAQEPLPLHLRMAAGETGLHAACDDPGQTRRLLAEGAPVNAGSMYTGTALLHALRVGNAEVVDLLLAAGADPHALCEQGGAMMAAVEGGRVDLVARLLALGVPVDQRNPCFGETPLMRVRFAAQEPLARFLLDAGADPTAVAETGATVLNRALRTRVPLPLLDRLLAAGASPLPLPEPRATSPLLTAAEAHPAALPALLAAGANPLDTLSRHKREMDALTLLTEVWFKGTGTPAQDYLVEHGLAPSLGVLMAAGTPKHRVPAFVEKQAQDAWSDSPAEFTQRRKCFEREWAAAELSLVLPTPEGTARRLRL